MLLVTNISNHLNPRVTKPKTPWNNSEPDTKLPSLPIKKPHPLNLHQNIYNTWVQEDLRVSSNMVIQPEVLYISKEAESFLEEFTDKIYKKEGYVKEKIYTRTNPSPNILNKDNKNMDVNGKFTTYLIIMSTNFTGT